MTISRLVGPALSITLAMILWVPGSALGQRQNLVVNGGFEQADAEHPDRPAEFEPGQASARSHSGAEMSWTSPGYESDRCLSVRTRQSSDLGYWQTIVPVEPVKVYTISFMYRTGSGEPDHVLSHDGTVSPAKSVRERVGGSSAPGEEAIYNRGRPGGPNLELGAIPDDPAQAAQPTSWTDIESAMSPLGGIWLPPSTSWRRFAHTFTTRPDQTRLRVKLRLYCYAQEAWFDDLSIVAGEAPVPAIAPDEQWIIKDTTPVMVFRPSPPPNSAAEPNVTLRARLSKAATARLWLDGEELTSEMSIFSDRIELGGLNLSPGAHRVRITAVDEAGDNGNELSWQFGVGEPLRNVVEVTTEGQQLNGEPFYPVAIYAYACHPADGRFRGDHLQEAADRGYNLVLNTMETIEGLDRQLAAGVMGTLNITGDFQHCNDAESARAALFGLGENPWKSQGRFYDHPAVFAYWADDPENIEDTLGTPTPPTTVHKLAQARTAMKQYSPHRPAIFAISNLPRLVDAIPFGDVLLGYRYPVPRYHPMMIYGWTIHYYEQKVTDKPRWFLSQAVDLGLGSKFGVPDEHRPTAVEIRAMAFYSIVCGVHGFGLYANYLNRDDHPGLWEETMRLGEHLRYLSPVLIAGQPAHQARLEVDATSAAIFHRELRHDGRHTLVAVNLSADRVAATWLFNESASVVALFEDRAAARPTTRIGDVFEPWQVHVYQWP